MGEPKRIQLKRTKGWRMPENTVKVDRSNKCYGNPFRVGEDPTRVSRWWLLPDDFRARICTKERWPWAIKDNAEAVEAFRLLTEAPSERDAIRTIAPHDLAGKNLACWCPLDQPCHADVLLELANAPTPRSPQ